LLSQGRDKEALKIVQWIYKTNKGKKDHDDFKVRKLVPEAIAGFGDDQSNM